MTTSALSTGTCGISLVVSSLRGTESPFTYHAYLGVSFVYSVIASFCLGRCRATSIRVRVVVICREFLSVFPLRYAHFYQVGSSTSRSCLPTPIICSFRCVVFFGFPFCTSRSREGRTCHLLSFRRFRNLFIRVRLTFNGTFTVNGPLFRTKCSTFYQGGTHAGHLYQVLRRVSRGVIFLTINCGSNGTLVNRFANGNDLNRRATPTRSQFLHLCVIQGVLSLLRLPCRLHAKNEEEAVMCTIGVTRCSWHLRVRRKDSRSQGLIVIYGRRFNSQGNVVLVCSECSAILRRRRRTITLIRMVATHTRAFFHDRRLPSKGAIFTGRLVMAISRLYLPRHQRGLPLLRAIWFFKEFSLTTSQDCHPK